MRGFHVEIESDPQRVIEHLEQNYKLAVVLDLQPGSMNSADVLQAVRTKYPSKPIVLMTAYGEEMTASITKDCQFGVYTCLYKPFEMDALFQMIADIRSKKLQNLLAAT